MTAEKRSEVRARVFLTAALDTGDLLLPVRIRNISSRGALVDGPALPPIGAQVHLVRGQLRAKGQFVWEGIGQGGVTFDDRVDVDSWVKRVGHPGQQRIDTVVAALRRSDPVTPDLQQASPETLSELSAKLDQVCERLANAAGISIEIGEELLKLDALAQRVRQLATGRKIK